MKKELEKSLREDLLKTIDPSYFTSSEASFDELKDVKDERKTAAAVVLRISTLRMLLEELGVLTKRIIIE